MANWPFHSNAADTESKLRELNQTAIARSAEFFAYDTPRDFRIEGDVVRFTSAVETPYEENNTVEARYFPGKARWKRGRKAGRAAALEFRMRRSMFRFARELPSSEFRLCVSACRITIGGCRVS